MHDQPKLPKNESTIDSSLRQYMVNGVGIVVGASGRDFIRQPNRVIGAVGQPVLFWTFSFRCLTRAIVSDADANSQRIN